MAARAPWDMEISVRTLQLSERTGARCRSEGHRQRAWSARRAVPVAHTWFSVAVYEYLGQICVRGVRMCFFMVEIQGTVDNSRPVGVVHPVAPAAIAKDKLLLAAIWFGAQEVIGTDAVVRGAVIATAPGIEVTTRFALTANAAAAAAAAALAAAAAAAKRVRLSGRS